MVVFDGCVKNMQKNFICEAATISKMSHKQGCRSDWALVSTKQIKYIFGRLLSVFLKNASPYITSP
jgi:hypothetical protein